jgi:glycosyltransferase involved in cell wall biosynthesis
MAEMEMIPAQPGVAPRSGEAEGSPMGNHRISIIVCTYNRADFLGRCLDSLLNQGSSLRDIEIIVVDNNSTDGSREEVERRRGRFSGLRYAFEREQGLSNARNRGCREAEGEYLAYLDDDALVPPGYLVNVRKVIEEHRPDILGGPIYPFYLTPKPRWFRDEYEVRKFAEASGFIDSCRASGGNFIIRKEVLVHLGMFDPHLGMVAGKVRLGEERAVIEKYRSLTPPAARRGYYSLDCSVLHYVPPHKMTLRGFYGRYFQSGRTAARLKITRRRGRAAAAKVACFIPNLYHKVVGDVHDRGLRGIDPVMIGARGFILLGSLYELLGTSARDLARKLARREGPRLPDEDGEGGGGDGP